MTVDYVESSALAKLVLDEPEHTALAAYLDTIPGLVTSLLTVAEVHRSAARRGAAQTERVDGALTRFTLLDIDRRVIEAAATLQPPALRTLDAIHLASALQLGPELRSFVTYDQRLAAAARAVGLPVASPGT